MSINIGSMSSSQRNKLADSILAASEHMSVSEKADLVEKLQILLEADVKAKARDDRKQTAMANINACRSGSLAERNMINLLEGNLRRVGIDLDQIVAAPEKIDQIFASADRKLSPETRMGIKAQLHRLGVIGK